MTKVEEGVTPSDSVGVSPCAICLEVLAVSSSSSSSLGACVPCGHVFHKSCFQRWKTSCQQKQRDEIKCPSCNQISTQFTELFLDLPAVVALPPRATVAAATHEQTAVPPAAAPTTRLTRSAKRKALELIKVQQQRSKKSSSTASDAKRNKTSASSVVLALPTPLERATAVAPVYMESHGELHRCMRATLVDWLFEVHDKLQHAPDTLYTAVNYLDRYLANTDEPVRRKRLQLTGICAYAAAAKIRETKPVSAKDCAYMCAGQYTEQEVSGVVSCVCVWLGVQCRFSVLTALLFLRARAYFS